MNTGIGWYLDKISRVPLLTPAEEVHLGTLIRAWRDHPDGLGDGLLQRDETGQCVNADAVRRYRAGMRARDRLVAANLRLPVSFITSRFSHLLKTTELDDLLQAANAGLVRAAEKFDPAQGYKFSTYAYWWIRQAVNRYADSSGLIRVPVHRGQQQRRLHQLATKYASCHGIAPTMAELAAAAGITIERAQELLHDPRCTASLDQLVGDDITLADGFAGPAPVAVERSPEHRQLLAALARLEPAARAVIELRYGFWGESLSAMDAATALDIPVSQVRCLERKAMVKLRLLSAENCRQSHDAQDAHASGDQLSLVLGG